MDEFVSVPVTWMDGKPRMEDAHVYFDALCNDGYPCKESIQLYDAGEMSTYYTCFRTHCPRCAKLTHQLHRAFPSDGVWDYTAIRSLLPRYEAEDKIWVRWRSGALMDVRCGNCDHRGALVWTKKAEDIAYLERKYARKFL